MIGVFKLDILHGCSDERDKSGVSRLNPMERYKGTISNIAKRSLHNCLHTTIT